MIRFAVSAVLACAASLGGGCGQSERPAAQSDQADANVHDQDMTVPPVQHLTLQRSVAQEPKSDAPKGPARATVHGVTMEILELPRYEWEVTIPSQTEFIAHVGLRSEGPQLPEGAAAHFAVTFERPEAPPVVLAEKVVTAENKGWVEIRASLGDYAGKQVRLVLTAEPVTTDATFRALWGDPTIRSTAPRDGVPVILISCDTVRTDHLGCYGYSRDTSPNIDAFAKEAVVFEQAVTPETWTLTAHLSMLTGLSPLHHRVTAYSNLAEEIVTLPEVLRDAGYATGGFTGYGIWLNPARGFAQGFDRYSTPPITRSLFKTLDQITPWLRSNSHAPFFLFFHNYDSHSKFKESDCVGCDLPYYPPRKKFLKYANELTEPPSLRAEGRPESTDLLFAAIEGKETLSGEEIQYMIALYDDAIRGVDHGVGMLLDTLKELGVYDKALIVITSDHGENFGEHGQFLHEHVYEGSARMPLLIRFPNGEHGGKRIMKMVQLTDLAPTILDAMGVKGPPMDGQGLLPVVRGEQEPRETAFIKRLKYAAARTNEWKLIRNTETKTEELYRIADDPEETINVLATEPPILTTLRAELDRNLNEAPQTPVGAEARPMTPEEIEALRALGYAADIE